MQEGAPMAQPSPGVFYPPGIGGMYYPGRRLGGAECSVSGAPAGYPPRPPQPQPQHQPAFAFAFAPVQGATEEYPQGHLGHFPSPPVSTHAVQYPPFYHPQVSAAYPGEHAGTPHSGLHVQEPDERSASLLPAAVASPEHLYAYSEQSKRTISAATNNQLLPKRDQLLTQQARLKARMDEVHAVKLNIESETRAEFESILQRLQSSESMKMLVLQSEHDEITRQIHAVQKLTEDVDTFVRSKDPALEVLGRYRALHDNVDRLSTKGFKESIDVSADDYQQEVRTYAEINHKYQALQKLVSVKDQMIWSLLEERAQLQKELAAANCTNYQSAESLPYRPYESGDPKSLSAA